MLCISRLPRSRRTVQKDVQVFSASIQFWSTPLRIKIFEHRNDIVNILYIPARNADTFHIVFTFFRLLRAHRYAQKFGMRRRNLTHNIQRGKIRRLHPLRLTNRQSNAPRHYRNFLGNILYFVVAQNRFRLLRLKNRLPNCNAFLITERKKFQRIVKPATSTIFNTRNIIRNPNNRRFQILKNDIQQTFLRLIQNQISLVHQNYATTPLTFPISKQHRTQTSLQKGFLIHRFIAHAHSKQRDIQLLSKRFRKFRFSSSFTTVKKDIEWRALLMSLQHLQNKKCLRIRLGNLSIFNTRLWRSL